MRTTSIDVTPAGNGLFQVDLRDDAGHSTHEVAVPDAVARRFEDDELSLQDVVLATMEWRLDREEREAVPTAFSLEDLQGTDDFDERVPEIARSRATGTAATTGQQREERSLTDSDERLVEQVKQEQADGQATPGTERF